MRLGKTVVLVCVLVGLSNVPANADPGDLLFDLQKPNHVAYDRFGRAVAAMGNNVIVSAPFDDTAGFGAGAAYLYNGSTGELLQTFLNPTPDGGEYFGRAVAPIGNRVLVGDTDESSVSVDGGAVFMFDASSGNLLRTFHNPTPSTVHDGNAFSDEFGKGIAAVGNKVLIGAWDDYDESGVDHAGAAYLFDADTAELLHTFISPTPTSFDRFGWAVAAVAGNIVISATGFDLPQTHTAGAVYVFDGGTYELLHTWTNPHPDPHNSDQFGFSLDALGDNVLIGGGRRAWLFDPASGDLLLEAGEEIGIYVGDHELIGYGIAQGVVSAVGDDILIGAQYDCDEGTHVGRAYLFDGDTGDLKLTIHNPSPDTFEYFGIGAAGLANGNMVVSADYDDTFGGRSGKTYIFAAVPEPGTLCLLACGGLCLVWYWRRRRNRVARP